MDLPFDPAPAGIALVAGAADGWVFQEHQSLSPFFRAGLAAAGVVGTFVGLRGDFAETLIVCGLFGLGSSGVQRVLGAPATAPKGMTRAAANEINGRYAFTPLYDAGVGIGDSPRQQRQVPSVAGNEVNGRYTPTPLYRQGYSQHRQVPSTVG